MKLKTSAHYVLRYNLVYVIVDRIWLAPVMVDEKYKYLKISPLQKNIVISSIYWMLYWWWLLYFKINKKIILASQIF